MRSIKDYPNKNAKIGLLCYKPFHHYVYKNIYKYLPNAEYIIGDGRNSSIAQDIKKLTEFIAKQDVFWRIIPENLNRTQLKNFYKKYDVLVSPWYFGAMMAEYNQDQKLVRVLYSNAGDIWSFGPWNAFFDLILTFGSHSQKYLSAYGNAQIVGNPRFDDWFKDTLDKDKIIFLRSKLDAKKKTILYTPTHGRLSSLPFLPSVMQQVTQKYNVLLRVHYNSLINAKTVVNKYKKDGNIVFIEETEDILPLLHISDYVFVDNGSEVFDALLAQKPIIFLNPLSKNFFNTVEKNIYYNGDVSHGLQTNEDSLEQIIKRSPNSIGPIIDLFKRKKSEIYKDILKTLDTYEHNLEKYRKRMKEIREMVFSYNDGTAGKKAADEILALLENKKIQKNFLSQSIISYLRNSSKVNIQEKLQKIYGAKIEQENTIKLFASIHALPIHKRILFLIKEFF